MASRFHPPIEEYLEAVYELEEEGVDVIRARLAERLGHAAPTVTEVVRKLVEDGYLTVFDRSLRLTESGRTLAEGVVRKHRLAERLLCDVIGLDWSKTHREAGRWEHVISDEVEERLIALLGNPTTCPHGNPIPGSGGDNSKQRPLADVEEGEQVQLERVAETIEMDIDSLSYLDHHGLRPGVSAVVRSKAPDGTLTLELADSTAALGPGIAAHVFVAAS
jgi:DtxR family Mn-dependent transcriptional regulator